MSDSVASTGKVAGRFTIVREIGRGGMATVMLAREIATGRLVALKMLREDVASSVNTERFLREVDVATALVHPHILPLLAAGVGDDGLPFYAMPYVQGETLRERLEREKQLPLDVALAIVAQAGSALAAAHAQGILHRDVTPGNILLEGDTAYLSDFGIARAVVVTSGERLTGTGMIVGTPEYMSPEQAAGDQEADARADLYSLAAVLYTSLAGEPPFTGPTAQAVLARKAVARAPDVRELRATTPPGVARAIARALEPAPADRQRSVAQFLDELARPDRGGAPRRHTRRTVAMLAVGAVLVVAGGVAVHARRDTVEGARSEMMAGRLASAIPRLQRASARDPADGRASLALAEALLISGTAGAESQWRSAALRAERTPSLTALDGSRGRALAAMARGDYAVACPALRHAADTEEESWLARLLYAECLLRDSAVVNDSSSASRWRFRASWHDAAQSYLQVLDEMPEKHEARSTVYRHVNRVLRVEWTSLRQGRGARDSTLVFYAVPELVRTAERDTVAYTPHPVSEFRAGQPWMHPPTQGAALEHDRAILGRVASAFVADHADSAEAHQLLARALELQGKLLSGEPGTPSAAEEFRRARALSRTRAEQIALMMDELRVRVKTSEFARVRALADSVLVLTDSADTRSTAARARVLALTGRTNALLALYARDDDGETAILPDGRTFVPHAELARSAGALMVHAMMWSSRDSAAAALAAFETALRRFTPRSGRDSVRVALAGRALTLGTPVLGAAVTLTLPPGTGILAAQQALARGDIERVRAELEAQAARRAFYPSSIVSIDAVAQEAWLRLAVGDTASAERMLGDALDGLPAQGTRLLASDADAASLRHLMFLRAELAARRGDGVAAARWRAALATLEAPHAPRRASSG